MSRARNSDGKFMSKFDASLAVQEAQWHAEIKEKMDAGLTFDEAWIAAGGDIIPTSEATSESVAETRAAYTKAGRRSP